METEKKETLSEGVVNLIRGGVRPVVTVFLTVHWAMLYWNVMEAGGGFSDIDIRYTMLVFGSILWWFGDRTLLKGKSIVALIKGEK